MSKTCLRHVLDKSATWSLGIKHNGTVKKWPVCLSRQPSSANLADEVQMLLSRLSDPAEEFVQAVQCSLHRSPCVILYTKQQINNCCVLPHKNFISSMSFNALHYVCPTDYRISTVCLPIPSVGHWWDRQTGLFHYVPSFSDSDPSVVCSNDRKTDLFQTGQADGPFSRSCLRVPSVRFFHCPICPVMF